jgi:hypothetical protein
MEHSVLDQIEVAEEDPGVIQVCPLHGCVYDERGLCELCEEEKALPIWATPQQVIRTIMGEVPGGSFRNGDSPENENSKGDGPPECFFCGKPHCGCYNERNRP